MRMKLLRALLAGALCAAAAGTMLTATVSPAAAANPVVAIAERELNDSSRNYEYRGSDNCTYYGKVVAGWPTCNNLGWGGGTYNGDDTYNWCAVFAEYVWREAGVSYLGDVDTWARSFKSYGVKHGTWHARTSGYTPRPGDAIVFDWGLDGNIDHVGIVRSVSGSTVYTIEGNVTRDDGRQGIAANSYSSGYNRIVGYSSPVGVAASSRQDMFVLYGNSNGYAAVHKFTPSGSSFTKAKTWEVTSGYSVSKVGNRSVTGDFNGDGRADLATAYDYGSGAARIHVWLGGSVYQSGNGWWSTSSGFDLNRVGGRMAAGDFNGDGRDDVAMLYGTSGGYASVELFHSTGSRFSHVKSWYVASGYAVARTGDRLVAGDFDGNGRDDLATAYDYGSGAARIHVWLNGSVYQSGNGWWSTSSGLAMGLVAGRMAAGDFTGDGRDDVAMLYGTTGSYASVELFPSTGRGFSHVKSWSVSSGYTVAKTGDRLVAGDFDGNGRADLATAYDYGSGAARVHVWLNGSTYQSGNGWWSVSSGFDLNLIAGRMS